MRLVDIVNKNSPGTFDVDFPVIVADAVWDGIDRGPDRVWKAKDFPCIAPPFKRFMIEARSQMGDIVDDFPGIPLRRSDYFYSGILFFDVSDRADSIVTTPPGQSRPPGTHWILSLVNIVSFSGNYSSYPGNLFIHVGEKGEWLDEPDKLNFFVPKDFAFERSSAMHRMFEDSIPFSLMTLSLMNCKNVEVVEAGLSAKQQKRARKHRGHDLHKYYTLKIRTVTRHAGTTTSHGSGMTPTAVSIRRGHFKNHMNGNGLFGKWKGLYWWDEMIMGSAESGFNHKRYEVENGQESH